LATRALAPTGQQWINGSSIRIHFLGGTAAERKLVEKVAPEWTEYANLAFEFVDDPSAVIRIAFDEDGGAWSYIGTENVMIPRNEPTMNLGWVDEAVILHEFGHMIGLGHEHQSPKGGIRWNEAQVLKDLAGPPNYWDAATARQNVLEKYAADRIHGTQFDPDSIMLYAFPADWTTNMPEGTKENGELSDIDKEFIRGTAMYPGRLSAADRAITLPVAIPNMGRIGSPGEEDLYKFEVIEPGVHVVETEGRTNVVLSLFGPDSLTAFVAQDDDGGEGRNARIRVRLQPGTYYCAVRHYNPTSVGNYGIRVLAASN
jgi:hypothetical protein